MRYPAEISNIKFKVRYKGRSTKRFTFNEEYEVTYAYGEQRGWKASSLDYLILSDGYRILPWEEKHYWEWVGSKFSVILNIMYGRSITANSMKNLVYAENPFLKMIKKDDGFNGAYLPIPIIYGD